MHKQSRPVGKSSCIYTDVDGGIGMRERFPLFKSRSPSRSLVEGTTTARVLVHIMGGAKRFLPGTGTGTG